MDLNNKRIQSALISVFDKTGLEPLIKELHKNNVVLYSTGGTQAFIESLGVPVERVEDLTSYPSILGGRVKTLHPKIFGGILNRRDNADDAAQLKSFDIPEIDLVIVDLYPFEATVTSGASHEEIIEKIDIGGISLIRAAAKNYNDVVIISMQSQYGDLVQILENQEGCTTLTQRKAYAGAAFHVSSHYDTLIHNYFCDSNSRYFKQSIVQSNELRYGENPHQKGFFFGDLDAMFTKISGKELSFNNLLDVDAAVNLMEEFKTDRPTFAILKHNNPCGIATRNSIEAAYNDALKADPVSAFGGILISNSSVTEDLANLMNDLFFEVLIAPAFEQAAIDILTAKKNRILLIQQAQELPKKQFRSALNGVLVQDKDLKTERENDLKVVTKRSPEENETTDLLFANKIVKHVKSNTIVLAKNDQMLACGTGQTSRVDALNQAIHKAKQFGFDLNGASMSSDAFFPFPDCVEIAHKAGITAVIQPGGSIKDELSIDYCNNNNLAMVFTGTRHFKH
jgi:phosphoribosylaminoimidazolecarboxamide formyltransferase/IMP cyclohydrolase